MKTTLVIDRTVLTRLKHEAAARGTTVSALVEAALRAFLERPRETRGLEPLPSFDGGGSTVDISDRDALYHAMEGR